MLGLLGLALSGVDSLVLVVPLVLPASVGLVVGLVEPGVAVGLVVPCLVVPLLLLPTGLL